MSLTLSIFILIICVLLSAFFSSSETAFISVQKLRLKHLESKGTNSAKRVNKILQNPSRLLSTVLLGNNLTNTAASVVGTIIVISLLGGQESGKTVLIATLAVTVLLLIFGEITPKTLATRHGERMAMFYSRPIEFISWLFYPIATGLAWIGTGLASMLGGPPPNKSLISEEEIQSIISLGREEGVVEETEADMLTKVFEFGDRQVRETMIPRAEIIWIEKGTNLSDFLKTYIEHSHSYYPVYEKSIDNVIGVLASKDVFIAQAKGLIDQKSIITRLAKPGYFVPESKYVGELFREMQTKGKQTAIVVDEFGGTDGMVNMKQLAEEVVGRLGDKLAIHAKGFEKIDENTIVIDGKMRIDQANHELNLSIPEGQYETVAGFILSLLGHIPDEGEQITYNEMKLTISKTRGNKIGKIILSRS